MLSSTFHRRLLWLLSGRAIIEIVNPFADRTGGLAPALAAVVGLTLLVSACGGSPRSRVAQLGSTSATAQSSSSSDPATTSSQRMLAFSRCVREHGVTNYPDPDSSGHLPASGKQIARSSPRYPAAENACAHLLSSGAMTQGDQQKIAFALKVAQCVRRHGFPTYPDPVISGRRSQGSGTRFEGTGIDTKSPRFQTAEIDCEKQMRKSLALR
jgi:hypothetical protein